MRIAFFALIAICSLHSQAKAQPTPAFLNTDWPCWRGADLDGHADPEQQPPLAWSEENNIRWRCKIPGRGHSSPTILGNQVFLATADEQRQVQLVLCFDRDSGKQNWEAIVHEGRLKTSGKKKANKKASLASSTVATDGER
ncbi:MAG: serine/threonine protein kinase, partial [Rubripirellula sp.]